MKVAIYSRTPLAAAPWELYKALRKYTRLQVTLINHMDRYPDGRIFPRHLLFSADAVAARKALLEADVWHVHNYDEPALHGLHKGQPIVAQFHSLPRLGTWKALWDWATHRYTIRQPLQEREYQLPGLPNLIDPDEYRPAPKTERISIAYAPSSKAPLGVPSSKGYHHVRQVLGRVAAARPVDVLFIEHMAYETNLEIKSRAHILVDDVVTGNWHRTSLEGACFGCAVLNRCRAVPFVYASLDTLEAKLLQLIDNPTALATIQRESRLWALNQWHAMDQVAEYVAAYTKALQ